MYFFLNLSRFALFVLWRSIQSQFKTIQPQLKVKGKRRKKIQLSQKGCFLLQMFISIYNCKCKGLQGGTLCGPVFLQFFKRGLKRKQLFWKHVFFLNLSRFALFVFWRSIQSQFKTIQPQLKVKGKRRKKIQLSQKGCFLLQMFISIYNCKCKGLQGGTLCGPVFCNFLKGV